MRKLEAVKRERIVFFSFVFISIITLIIFSMICKGEDIRITYEPFGTMSDEWFINDGEEVVTLPSKLVLPDHGTISLSCVIPDQEYTGKALFFDCSYLGCIVYVDDEEIWKFASEPTMPFGAMRGSATAIVPLNNSYVEKELKIQLMNHYGEITSEFNQIQLGSEGEMKFYLLRNNLWRIAFFFVLLAFGIVSFLMGVVHIMTLENERNMSFVYFAAIAFSVGVWIIADPNIMQFFTYKTTVAQFAAFASLICIGAFYMGLCSSLFTKHRYFFDVVRLVGYMLLICMIVCYVTSLMDPTRFMYIIFIYAFVFLFVSTVYIMFHLKEYDFAGTLLNGTVVLLLGIGGSLVSFLNNPLKNNSVIYFSIGYGVYIFILFIIMFRDESKLILARSDALNYERMAYSDFLTGLLNRAALEKDLNSLTSRNEENLCVELFIGDVNLLKWTNDNLGHAKGDELICETANCLKNAFSKWGNTYRLGGDEFAVLIINGKASKIEMLDSLNREIDRVKDEKDLSISIAMGYAKCYFPMENPRLEQILYHVADQDMYRVKQKMKENIL